MFRETGMTRKSASSTSAIAVSASASAASSLLTGFVIRFVFVHFTLSALVDFVVEVFIGVFAFRAVGTYYGQFRVISEFRSLTDLYCDPMVLRV